jgi:uncharacterized protein YbcI
VSSGVPGFDFRYRIGGGQPTIRSLAFKSAGTLTHGDMLKIEEGQVGLGATGDLTLVGGALQTLDGEAGSSYIRVITDGDAVYAVDDGNARKEGDRLDLTGVTGAQGVATSTASEFSVVVDCVAEEETLVRINPGSHHAVAPAEGWQRPAGGELNAAVARAVVQYHRSHTGRGPTKAQAFYRNNVIVVLLEGMLTKAERALIASGRPDAVRLMRNAFQDTMRSDLVATVEELTGTPVVAFMSSNQLEPDMAVAVFVLAEPVRGEPTPPSAD